MAKASAQADAESNAANDTLFQGTKFWLSQRVPQRSRFLEQIRVCAWALCPTTSALSPTDHTAQANGGVVVPLENKADIKIVDHVRQEHIPESYLDHLCQQRFI